jgi:hypothetical protein
MSQTAVRTFFEQFIGLSGRHSRRLNTNIHLKASCPAEIRPKRREPGSILGSQFSAIFANLRRKNWRFSQKPML